MSQGNNNSIINQIKKDLIAIISVFIAVTALVYNTWRNEHSEKNRTIRIAAFEVLKELSELQLIVNYSYKHKESMGDPITGWKHIAYLNDLTELLPQTSNVKIKSLTEVWNDNWEKMNSDEKATDKITGEIDSSRAVVLEVIRALK